MAAVYLFSQNKYIYRSKMIMVEPGQSAPELFFPPLIMLAGRDIIVDGGPPVDGKTIPGGTGRKG